MAWQAPLADEPWTPRWSAVKEAVYYFNPQVVQHSNSLFGASTCNFRNVSLMAKKISLARSNLLLLASPHRHIHRR